MKLGLASAVFTVAVLAASTFGELETLLDKSDGTRQLHFIGTVDGKSFFYDNDPETYKGWSAAAAYCASSGMHLASLDTKAQYDLIANFTDVGFIEATYFWTSGRDSQDMNQLKWDDTNDSAASASTYMNITGYVDHLSCLRLNRSNEGLLFFIVGCETDENYPLCET